MRKLAPLAAIALLALAPAVLGDYGIGLLTECLIFAIFAMSLDLLIGYTGLLSFGHAAFFGSSAYAVVVLNVHLGVNGWLGFAAGIALSTILACLIGAVSIRVSGIAFLMLTVAFAQLLFSAALKWRDVTGGTDGLGGLVRPTLFGSSLDNRVTMFYVAAVCLVASIWALRRLVAAPLGSVFIGIKANAGRMHALGYKVRRFRLLSFTIAGTFAGLAGGLYGLFNGFISTDALNWSVSGDVIIMVILGGAGTIIGPAIGAAIFLVLRDVVSSWTDHWMFLIGAVFIACVMVLPQGVWGAVLQLSSRRWGRR